MNAVPAVPVCSNAPFVYSITGNVAGITFTWSRATVAGISNPPVSGQTSSTINENLTNTTGAPIEVTYIITPRANGCDGPSFELKVKINHTPATPVINTNSPICLDDNILLTTATVAGALQISM